jgi:glycosyltransferase involved in cell wall biosynthesis
MRANLSYLISRYPSISHTFILREIRELRRLGFRIHVASINDPDRHVEKLTAEECEEARSTLYVKSAGLAGALRAHGAAAFCNPVGYFRGIRLALRLGGTDVRKVIRACLYFVEAVIVGQWMKSLDSRHLHVHFATPAATVGLIVKQMFNVTLSITVHGPDEFYDVPGYLLLEKISAATLLCAIGCFARSQLMKIADSSLWEKIHVTPLGVDAELFKPRPRIGGIRPFEVICVGRLVPAKGQQVLLAAIAKLTSQGREVRLRLVGEGPDRRSLHQAARQYGIERRVVFEGAVDQDRIQDLYGTADIFALASFAEGIPVVLMEAMSMELPCVSTWVNGIPELIRDSIEGLLVPPADVDALASAIARLMDDENLRGRLGAAGRRRVIDKFDLRKNVAHLAEVFDAHLLCKELDVAA